MDEMNINKSDMVLTDVDIKSVKITAEDTSGIKAALLSVIGDYETIVTDYTYSSGGGGAYSSHNIDIQPDYCWIAACLTFIVLLYSLMRIVGKAVDRR